MKATFTIEYEADNNGERGQYFLEQGLARAKAALKNAIERGKLRADGDTGIRQGSTKIAVVKKEIE